MTTLDAAGLLRSAGLRVTEPRLAVLAALDSQPHAAADAVHAWVRAQLPEVSLQTVYNVLRDLTERGLTRSIEPADHPARYELRVGDNHHHLVCTGCGVIADVDCIVGQAPCLDPDDDHGFAVAEAEVTFWGRCADCRAQLPAPADSLSTTS